MIDGIRGMHPASEHLERLRQRMPDIWSRVEQMRRRNIDDIGGPNWPAFCYLPLEHAAMIVAELMHEEGVEPTPALVGREASLVAGLSAWRMTQGIYRYDPSLYATLIDTPMGDNLPAGMLQHLPEWCVYIETPQLLVPTMNGEIPLCGCYAWVDRARRTRQDVLTLLLDADGAQLAISHVPIVGTMEAAIRNVAVSWSDAYRRGNASAPPMDDFEIIARARLTPIVSLILHLCIKATDVSRQRGMPMQPIRRWRSGERLFEADGPTIKHVGGLAPSQ